MHKDQEYITALKNHDSPKIEEIYQRWAPGIQKYLCSKGASIDEAGDLFQEALIDLYKCARDSSFVLTCPLEAFLLLICKRKWINLLEKSSRQGVTNTLDDGSIPVAAADQSAAEQDLATWEKETLVVELLDQVSARCREIIIASYTEKPQQQVAREMGVSYAYLRKKKSQCMADLIALVRNKKQHAA